ncbi:neuregulin 1 [Rhinolophus ferrumequinum]|uniref:Neuregulin 1 n=1 Tax=Rhinolophus ferrumequinum TaxID=59479 RepID=A0A7J7ZR92_RHIFE|nr:neuregulin 1 [Rhinolophus ferrumequinum]
MGKARAGRVRSTGKQAGQAQGAAAAAATQRFPGTQLRLQGALPAARSLAASAAAAASLHTKDCYPLSSSSTSTSSSRDSSPDSRARARRRRQEDLSLPATQAVAAASFIYLF